MTVTIGVRSPAHGLDRLGDRLGHSPLFRCGTGERPGCIDERHHGELETLGQPVQPDRLAIALGMGHPEVAANVLVDLAALLVANEHGTPPVDLDEPADDRQVVAEKAVAVELDNVRADLR